MAHRAFTETTAELVHSVEMVVDHKRQVAVFEPKEPLELRGDVKIIIQSTGSITDQTSFVWFNTKWVWCDALTLASSRGRSFSSSTARWTRVDRSCPRPPSPRRVVGCHAPFRASAAWRTCTRTARTACVAVRSRFSPSPTTILYSDLLIINGRRTRRTLPTTAPSRRSARLAPTPCRSRVLLRLSHTATRTTCSICGAVSATRSCPTTPIRTGASCTTTGTT